MYFSHFNFESFFIFKKIIIFQVVEQRESLKILVSFCLKAKINHEKKHFEYEKRYVKKFFHFYRSYIMFF